MCKHLVVTVVEAIEQHGQRLFEVLQVQRTQADTRHTLLGLRLVCLQKKVPLSLSLSLCLSHSLPCLPQLVDVTRTFPFSLGPEAMCPSRTPIAFASHKQATPSSWPWSMCSARMPDTIRSLRARKATMSYARMSNSLSRTDPRAKIHQCSCVAWSISPSKWAPARVCSPKYAAQQN